MPPYFSVGFSLQGLLEQFSGYFVSSLAKNMDELGAFQIASLVSSEQVLGKNTHKILGIFLPIIQVDNNKRRLYWTILPKGSHDLKIWLDYVTLAGFSVRHLIHCYSFLPGCEKFLGMINISLEVKVYSFLVGQV